MVLGLMYPSFEEALLAARARSSVIQDTYTAVHRPRRRSQDRRARLRFGVMFGVGVSRYHTSSVIQ